MKAMVLRAVGEPLSLEERPDLKPTAGQIRACVEASVGSVAPIFTSSMASTKSQASAMFCASTHAAAAVCYFA